jgi:ATP-dependent Clp protease ATP-binding subunit ClpX
MTEKKIPTPEEVQKEFEEFVRNRFGGSVQVLSHPMQQKAMPEGEPQDTDESLKNARRLKAEEFRLKPKEVKRHLDRFVVKQEEAKKALAIAVCDHYNQVRQCLKGEDETKDDYSKQNVLILGPTGVGKTYLVKQIAKLIGVPFVKADATKFSETGYVGGNVDDLVRDLVTQAEGDLEWARYGIIYLDEADKLATPRVGQGRDVTGKGVQTGLLKLMEETDVDLASGNDIRSQMQAFMEFQQNGKIKQKLINTRHILFIISGAFTGLDEIIKARLNLKDIGFTAAQSRVKQENDLFPFADTQDFVEYGFEPEFIGRLPIRVALHHLEAPDLFDILKSSEGSIIKQYRQAFKAYGIEVQFTDEALWAIAERAFVAKTGARALMTILEASLREYKFEFPSSEIRSFEITKDIIENPVNELGKLLGDKLSIARLKAVRQFEVDFSSKYQVQVSFSEEARLSISRKAIEAEVDVATFCHELLKSYEHGLKLIKQNTGQAEFIFGANVVKDPKGAMEAMIKESFGS